MSLSIPNINLTLKPSQVLFACFAVLHVLAALCLIFISVSVWYKLFALVLVLLNGVYTIKHYILLNNSNSIVRISISVISKLHKIEFKDGTTHHVHIKNAAWLFNYFATIVFYTKSKRYKSIIAKDTLSQEQFYALRLYLRSINSL